MVFLQFDAMTRDQVRHLQSLAEGHNFIVHHGPANARVEYALPSYSFCWSRDTIEEACINGREVQLRADHFIMLNPGQVVTVCSGRTNVAGFYQGSVSRELVKTTALSLKSSSNIVGKSASSTWPVNFDARPRACDGHFGPILRDIEKAASLRIQDGPWLEQHMRLLVELLLFDESVSTRSVQVGIPSKSLGGKLRSARKYLDTHFHQPIEIKDLARNLAISRAHFIREFRRFYGDTPYRYLMNKRLEAALRLMTEDEVPVGLVFERVGFNSGSVFYKAFRRRYNLTPSQARRTGVVNRA